MQEEFIRRIESAGSELVEIAEQNRGVAEEVSLNVGYAKANRGRKNLNDFIHDWISLVDGPGTNWVLAFAESDNDL